jgi:hypothetical protein
MDEITKQITIEQLESSLDKLEDVLNDTYSTFGKQIMEMAQLENRKINSVIDQIIEIKKQLYVLKKEDSPLCTPSCSQSQKENAA